MSAPGISTDGLIEAAKRAYINPRGKSLEEFMEDFSRLRYIKRLINRRNKGVAINDRLLLNHIVVWFNVFEVHQGLEIMLAEMDDEGLPVLLACTDYLNLTTETSEYVTRCTLTTSNLSML